MYQQYPTPQPQQYGLQYSGCMKMLLYVVSFLMPVIGIIAGIVFMSRPDLESKGLGQACLIIGIVSIVLACCVSVVLVIAWPTLIILLQEYALAWSAIA